jgi:hypothetical protein
VRVQSTLYQAGSSKTYDAHQADFFEAGFGDVVLSVFLTKENV